MSVYLRPGNEPGWVNVHKNSSTGTIVHEFRGDNDDGTGMYIVDSGSISDFIFVDQVPAEDKPRATTQDPDDHGIKVEADSGRDATLHIEAGPKDQLIEVTESSSTQTTVRVRNHEQGNVVFGHSRMGEGVSHLTPRPNEFPVPGNPNNTQATDYFPVFSEFGGGTDIIVQNLAAGIFLTVDTGAARYCRMWLGTDGGSGSGQLLEEANVITGAGACIVHLRGTDGAGNTTRARIDFGPRSQVGDNRLEVMLNGVATLAQLAGASHTVVVEEVNMQSSVSEKPAVLIVEDRSEIDDLDEIQHAQAYIEKTADDTEVGSWFVNLTCTARIQGKSTIGDFTIEGEVEFIGIPPNPPDPAIVKHSTVNNFEIDATSVAASNGKVNVSAYADVTALTPSRIGALEIRSLGKFALQEGTADLLTVGSLFILKGPTAAEGVLDLTDNAMIIDYTFDSPFAGIRDYIVQGYNFNDPPTPLWIGDGINSSTAAVVATNQNDPYKTGIGYAEASALFTSFPATWEGQTNVDNTSVLLKYTFYGDANLDGGVNLPDFNRLAANFGGTEKVWSEGDFHYDGNVNLQDFNRLAANFGQGTTVSTYDDYTTEELEEMLPD